MNELAEALEWVGRGREWNADEEPLLTIVAAARLVLDAREPDRVAAVQALIDHSMVRLTAGSPGTAKAVDAVIAAALGVDPGSKVRVLVIEE